MNIRQKLILQGSQEDPYNLTYNPEHFQMLFLKSLKTVIQSERITNFMKPHLENLTISDENLILHMNEAISEEEERQAKLAFQKKSKTVVNEVSKANCDDNKGKTNQNSKSASKSPLLAAVEGLKAQVAEIGGTAKLLQEKVDRSQLEQPVDHTQQKVMSEQGNKSFRKKAQEKQMKPRCESCKVSSLMTSVRIAGPVGVTVIKVIIVPGTPEIKRETTGATIEGQGVVSEAQAMSHHCNGCGKPEHNQNFYSVSSVVLISVKRKARILIRSYVRLFMSYPSQVNLKVRVTMRAIMSMLVTLHSLNSQKLSS